MQTLFIYASKGKVIVHTSSEFLARKRFKQKREQGLINGKLPAHVVRKFRPKFNRDIINPKAF